ncbi:CHAT domain-containing protein [Morchella snyderi]|nr:CHAT domain-containing protein [Morchella snyderi]
MGNILSMLRLLAPEKLNTWFSRIVGIRHKDPVPTAAAAKSLLEDIQRIEAALAVTPLHRPHRAHLLGQLSSCLAQRYRGEGDLEYLQLSITHLQAALVMTVLDSSMRSQIYASLSDRLRERFQRVQDIADLNAAVENMISALLAVGEDHPRRVEFLERVSGVLHQRYRHLQGVEDLNDAIKYLQEAVEKVKTPIDDPNRPIMLGNLATFFDIRHERLGALEDLESCIKFMEATIVATSASDPFLGPLLYNLSCSVMERWENMHDLRDLETAMEHTLRALKVIPADHPLVVTLSENMSTALETRYNINEDLADIDTAIQYSRKAVESSKVEDNHGRAGRLSNLSTLFMTRHQERPSESDLNEAIENVTKAIVTLRLSGETAKLPNMFTNQSIFYHARYKILHSANDLEKAIEASRSAIEGIEATNLDHPDRPGILSNLAACLSSRFELLRELGDLEEGIRNLKDAIPRVHEADPDRPNILGNMTSLLNSRYRQLKTVDDLNNAIKYAGEALSASRMFAKRRAGGLGAFVEAALTLCYLLHTRSQRLNSHEDLDSAILHAETILKELPQSHTDHPKVLHDLGGFLITRYNRRQSLSDLDTATDHMKACLKETREGDPGRVKRLNQLAVTLVSRYSRLRAPEDLKEGIEHVEEILKLTSEDDPKRAENLTYLSALLRWQHRRLDAAGSLHAAVRCAEAAANATPVEHPDYKSRLGDLSAALHARYDRFGDLKDLESAIRYTVICLKDTVAGSFERTRSLIDLSGLLRCKYRRFGALSDLEAGIEYVKVAVEETPLDHPDRERIFNSLGPFLGSRYARLGDSADLEAAIRHSRARLEATEPNDPSLPEKLESIAGNLTTLYMKERTPCDLDEAIQYIEKALEITPEDDPQRPGRLSTLGKCYHVRFEHSNAVDRNMNDLDAAIDCEQKSVLATPLDMPSRAHRLVCLGTNLRLRHKLKRKDGLNADDDRARAFNAFIDAWNCQAAPPNVRVQAVWRAVKFFGSYELISLSESSILLEKAVGMLPKISLRSLERDDQQQLLSSLYGLSSLAASFALKAGRGAYTTLKLLELGRGIITGFAIDNRSEMADLQTTHPTLYDRLVNLRAEANTPLPEKSSGVPVDHLSSSATKRRLALDEMEELLQRICEIPQYADFLLPPSEESLMKMAEDDTIVVMCTTSLRSDAIIVTKSGIESIELKTLLYKDAKARMRDISMNLVKGSFKTLGERNKKMVKHLAWLWDEAVKPVLDKVKPKLKTSRIWWIGIGELSRAPFHAAGHHKKGSARYTMSKVISSYIPTVKSLMYARQRKLSITSMADTRLLLVTMPSTPGHPALSGVEGEVAALVKIVESEGGTKSTGSGKTKVLEQPCAKTVMEELPEFDVVHFACHGVSDSKDPSNSSLLLLNRSRTEEPDSIDRLTVREISRVMSSKAQLAYLSACSTADNAAIELADETIHLASAFQLAGFNHVIGTLWQSKDVTCKAVAEDFYTRLYGSVGARGSEAADGFKEDHLKVSLALHEAAKKARATCYDRPLTWAPFIHTGA